MKFQAACLHDVLLVVAEIGMVVLAVRGLWALIAGCDVAERTLVVGSIAPAALAQ